MVHDPAVETWTFSALEPPRRPVTRAGFNFGAPGDRLDADGTLWLDAPSAGGPSPDLPVRLRAGGGASVRTIRRHPSDIESGPLPWVASSGIEGIGSVEIELPAGGGGPGVYVVRLVFAEIGRLRRAGGERRAFDVALQGRAVLRNFDIARAAGGARRSLVREFRVVRVRDRLSVSFSPQEGMPPAIICGLELVRAGP
jgi:hypothetical protein